MRVLYSRVQQTAMTQLSVNINKIATLRNARGGDVPNVVKVALDCEKFGAQGITVHPRPDERHIRYQDVYDLKQVVTTEFNIEGYPCEKFVSLVNEIKPAQVTLVPDAPNDITSHEGWDTVANLDLLTRLTSDFKNHGIRVSLFVNANPLMVEYAKRAGADRVELYTEPYAANYDADRDGAVAAFVLAAQKAKELGLGLNAGHDLNLTNLAFLKEKIPFLDEVSIGHALIADALYLGLEETIRQYKMRLVSAK